MLLFAFLVVVVVGVATAIILLNEVDELRGLLTIYQADKDDLAKENHELQAKVESLGVDVQIESSKVAYLDNSFEKIKADALFLQKLLIENEVALKNYSTEYAILLDAFAESLVEASGKHPGGVSEPTKVLISQLENGRYNHRSLSNVQAEE